MSEFEDRLKAAIERGKNRGQRAQEELAQQQATVEQLRRQHTQIRLTISEHIESIVKRLADYFPGFRYENVFGESGWEALHAGKIVSIWRWDKNDLAIVDSRW
ncbi:MAG: hypothetical protein U0905_22845 [Pirellulales bacterium]